MEGTIVHKHDTEASFLLRRKVVEEKLEAISVERRHLKEKAITRCWFHCTINIIIIEAMLYLLYWLYSFKCDTPTWVGH